MSFLRPFDPGINETIAQANATSSAGGTLPDGANTVALYNSSTTAIAYFVCNGGDNRDVAVAAVVPAGGTIGSFPVPPGQLVRITVPPGPKSYRTIASAADGTLFITPGVGN